MERDINENFEGKRNTIQGERESEKRLQKNKNIKGRHMKGRERENISVRIPSAVWKDVRICVRRAYLYLASKRYAKSNFLWALAHVKYEGAFAVLGRPDEFFKGKIFFVGPIRLRAMLCSLATRYKFLQK